jgi:hypothetical protein
MVSLRLFPPDPKQANKNAIVFEVTGTQNANRETWTRNEAKLYPQRQMVLNLLFDGYMFGFCARSVPRVGYINSFLLLVEESPLLHNLFGDF